VRPEEGIAIEAEEDTGDGNPVAAIEAEINKLIKIINRSSEGSELVLPAELPGGARLKWEESRNTGVSIVFLLLPAMAFAVYKNRYAKLKRMEAEARVSIIKELPEFINKMVLLLNAGLVLTSAFDRIIMSAKGGGKEVKSYFYSQLSMAGGRVRETNSSMISEFKEFAVRSGVREMIRISNIITDNADKGSELADKLQSESELLWLTKKKLAEEQGRLAESKLTFPLVLLLLVLIMVTIAPALMEM
jgi:Flp pilus assembly protein TadB